MSVVDLHPEDLLDREARGELSADELTHLLEHLEACLVCRFEREARGQFRAEFEDISRDKVPAGRLEPSRPPRRAEPRLRLVLLIAAALFVASAAAAEWSGIRRSPADAPATDGSSHASELVTKPSEAEREAPIELVAMTSASAAPEPSRPPPAPVASAPPRRIPAPARAAGPVESAATAADEAPPPPTASAMFEAANEARRRVAYDDALRLYADLVRSFPQSTEAVTSHAILGRLLLDHGDAPAALGEFDAYLGTGHATLREEALLGRALALERLERRGEEAAAWQALLDAFPRSIHGARARTRLASLGGR